ncbi:MAG: hypothetical protein FWD57_01260 [Polyangiaceae bacterium]|nr:hypothetical protein [Polyangiaceae bacterium]
MTGLLIAACAIGAALASVMGSVVGCDRNVQVPLSDRPTPTVIETSPKPQDSAFPLERAMRLRFDRYLNPSSVLRQSVLVTPGIFESDAGELVGPVMGFEPVYDPYDRIVVYQLLARVRWTPATLHLVQLQVPRDMYDIVGFRAFDGAPMDEVVSFSFMSGNSVSDPDNDTDDVLQRVRYCEEDDGSAKLPAVATVLNASCAKAGCHATPASSSSASYPPVLGMDLSSPAAVKRTAIRVVARQTMRGSSVSALSSSPPRFGDDMPRLDPTNAGNSYVVYKLLVNPANHPGGGGQPDVDPTDADPAEGPDPWLGGLTPIDGPPVDEISRLRSWFVTGEPMPLTGHLSPSEMRSIVRWILQGANMPECGL